jgi:hypothetical protein
MVFALTLMSSAISGCEVEGPPFKPMALPGTKAVVYVYRPYQLMGSIDEPEITCGAETIAIGAGGYHAFVEEPGTIKCFAAGAPEAAITLEVRPEESYFVREVVTASLTSTNVTLTPVNRSTGLDEIESTSAPQ